MAKVLGILAFGGILSVGGAIQKTQITFCMWMATHAFSMCEDHVIVNVFFVSFLLQMLVS
jgi:hypothetical protein